MYSGNKNMTARLRVGGLVAGWMVLGAAAYAQQPAFPPLTVANFARVDPGQGFGDRQNSWAWSMTVFKGKLYVGTNRAQQCVNSAAINKFFPDAQPYPPDDPDIECTPDYRDLPLRAEIWQLDPVTNVWTRVYQAPQDIPIPNTNPQKFVSRDIGYRGMQVFTEADGTQALYVGACGSRVLYGTAVPPGRMLRSTDGINFTGVPQDPGTFLGNMPNACIRGIQSLNGKLYAVATDFQGAGALIESANPKLGNNNWRQITPVNTPVYEFGVYNNNLYVSFSSQDGFAIYKTPATGNLPYTWKKIMAGGGYKTSFPNHDVLSMKVYKGRLYVGGNGVQSSGTIDDVGAELFRINPDDSWDLLVGESRSTPDGQKNALSGLGIGFGWNLNEHMWRMEVYDNRLYIGTFDAATVLRNNPDIGPAIAPAVGADLWYTSDGTHFSAVEYKGFDDVFNFGIRSLFATPLGLFLGTANYFYGTEIWRGTPTALSGLMLGPVGTMQTNTIPDPPSALHVENNGSANLLAWMPPPRNASKYLVYRYSTNPVEFPPDMGFADLYTAILAGYGTGVADGASLPVPSAKQLIGTTDKTTFVDTTAVPGQRYAYEVVAQSSTGQNSGASNYVAIPSGLPTSRFPDVYTLLQAFAKSGKFKSASAQQTLTTLTQNAQTAAATGNFAPLLQYWKTITGSGTQYLEALSAEDLALLLQKLVERAALVANGALPQGSL